MLKRIGKAVAAGALVAGLAALADFVAINWVTNCQTWDREQWTEQSSCVTPGDVWEGIVGAIVGKAHAEERSVRAVRRDYEQRISPSWEVRLERMDRDRERAEREASRKRERDWRRLTTTKDEECDE